MVFCRPALRQVMENIHYDHRKKYDLHFDVVIPDHVHLLWQPREKNRIRPVNCILVRSVRLKDFYNGDPYVSKNQH